MQPADFARLVALAAIWGGSFLFMRISVPVLGPAAVAEARVLLAALFLSAVGLLLGKRLALREHARHFAIVGLLNSALPFLLFSYAAQTLTASLLSIINASAPIWGAVIAALWGREPLTRRAALGLALGVGGVAVLVGHDVAALPAGAGWATAAALGAPVSYGLASVYARRAVAVDAYANAHGSMWAAGLMLLPVILVAPPTTLLPGPGVAAAVLALGVVCSGVAYLLYFRLIRDVGAAPALTVTFLIPVFGVLWGVLFLGESVGWHTLVGAVVVVSGTALVTGFSPLRLLRQLGVRG